jgi:hypothetical protein
LLLCLAAICLPQLRDIRLLFWQSFTSAHQEQMSLPRPEKLAQIVSRHPDNVYFHIAQAQIAAFQQNMQRGQSAGPADYRALAERFPDSEAAQLQYAGQLLSNAGPTQRKEAWGSKALTPPPAYRPRTAQEEKNLAKGIAHLRLAAQLNPENAVPQYLLVYALLQQHQDSSAQAALREAMPRGQWSTYAQNTRAALYELFEKSGLSTVFLPTQVLALDTWARGSDSSLRDLARILSALGERARIQGDQEQALLYYAALVHLGALLLNQADSISDGLLANAVLDITAGRFISPEERNALTGSHLLREAQIAGMKNIRHRHFRDYLLSRQRGDLAEEFDRETRLGEIFREKSRQVSDKEMALVMQVFNSRYLIGGFMFLLYAASALGLWVLAGLIALLTGTAKTDPQISQWRWGEWGALLLAVLVLGGIVIRLCPIRISGDSLQSFPIGEIIVPALLMLFPLIGGLRKTRRQPPLPAKARLAGALSGYRILLPPTFAFLLAAALVCFALTQSHMKHWAANEKQIVLRGEVAYWRLVPKE